MPEKSANLHQYALSFINKIDTSKEYILIGVSLGGMICTELSDTLDPVKTIIISSAKSKYELPKRYTFQQKIPLNKMIPANIVKYGAIMLQPIVEPDRNNNKDTFKSMLNSKDPVYLKRTANMIINWNRVSYNPNIIHIHGNKDNTIPIENTVYDYLIKNGSHMMILTRGDEICDLINRILAQ